MNRKDLIQITTVAMGTATLTVATFLAGSLDAVPGADSLPATIEKPTLVAQGLAITLTPADGCELKAGVQPAFDLRAVNSLDRASEVLVHLVLNASAPVSPMSRVMPVPATLWQDERLLTLGPNETKTVRVSTGTSLPANRLISVSMAEAGSLQGSTGARGPAPANGVAPQLRSMGAPGIVALSFSTVPADFEPKPTVALARSGSVPVQEVSQ